MRPAVGRSSEDARRHGTRRHELKTLSAASLLQTLPASRDDVLERKTDPESETPIQISAGSVRGPHVRAGSVSREQVKAGTNRQTCLSASAIASSALGKELSQVHAAVVARGGGIWALSEVQGVDEQAVKQWERDHGVAVAADLLDFLQATDGILVRWAVPLFGRVKDIGCLHVNSLRFIDPVASEDLRGSPIASRQAFALGKQKRVGLTALVYPRRYVSRREDQPEVWFCDLSGSWHFMAARFADYFRLALVHLGIRGWEYAFTPGGLDPDTKQWLRLMAPERLEIDETRAVFEPAYSSAEDSKPSQSKYALHLVDDLRDEDEIRPLSGAGAGASAASRTKSTRKGTSSGKTRSVGGKKKALGASSSRKSLAKTKFKGKTAAAGASSSSSLLSSSTRRPESAPARRPI